MELMVVIVIIVILASSMIPIMSSASDARRCREGARLVSTMLSSAQTRAISSGRSAGVLFQPMKNNPYACMEMYLVEVPPPYSGDDFGYTGIVNVTMLPPGSNPPWTATVTIKSTGGGVPTFGGIQMSRNQANNQRMIRPGDIIKFNYRGQTYLLNSGDSNPYVLAADSMGTATMTLTPTDLTGPPPPATPRGATIGMPFQISRQPIKTSDPPAQLADGAAVDWYFSGVDLVSTPGPSGGSPALNYPKSRIILGALGTVSAGAGPPPALGPAAMSTSCGPLIITFASTGSVEQVYYSCSYPSRVDGVTPRDTPVFYQFRPLTAAYVLVGKIEKISQLPTGPIQNDPANLPNYQDGDARWVSITRQSGLVTTTEIAKLQPKYANYPTSGTPTAYVLQGSATYPTSIPDWTSVLNAVMNSRRYASGNQNSGGI
jgi:type II secretory pathway pseudopilin PulG